MAEQWILEDGVPQPRDDRAQLLANRAFRLGDGVFETVRVMGGRPLFLPLHWARLQHGVRVLGLQPGLDFTYSQLVQQLEALLQANGVDAGGKLRLQVFRTGAEGAYLPLRDDCGWYAEANVLLHNTWPTDRTQRLAVYDGWRVRPTAWAGVKTTSALPYVLAARAAAQAGADDALLLDEAGNAAETSRANLFAVVGGHLYTAPAESGILPGVLRQVVLALAHELGIAVRLAPVPQALLAVAEEVFTTNVVSGIFPVRYIAPLGRSFPDRRPVTERLQQALERFATNPDLARLGLAAATPAV